MDEQSTRNVVEERIARFNAHDVEGLRQLFAATDEEWAPWGRSLEALFRAFPDIRQDVERMIVADDSAAVTARVSGTHADEYPAGELAGIAGTGRSIEWHEAYIFVVRDGRIVDGQLLVAGHERLQQLGVLPEPAAGFPPE